jgi:hypothetical protein
MVEGTIALTGIKAFGIDLGDAALALTPTPDGKVALAGVLFRQFKVEAKAGFDGKGLQAQAQLSFEDLKVEKLLADLEEQGISSTLSGRVNLNLLPGKAPEIDVLLSLLNATITREVEKDDGTSSKERVWLRNEGPIHISTDTERVTVDRTNLVTQGGGLQIAAKIEPIKDSAGKTVDQSMKASMQGAIDLDFLQPILANQLSALHGGVLLDLQVGGSVKKPDLNGQISIVRPIRADLDELSKRVFIPSGAVLLTSSAVELSNLAVTIDNATMKLSGKVGLRPGFVPDAIAVKADGDVSATLLEAIAPSAVSDVTGKASISATVNGKLAKPEIAARINLGEIEMRLRGISRQIAIKSGTVELGSKELLLRNVKVKLDDEGELLIGAEGVRPGRIYIRSLTPQFQWASLDLPLAGNRLGYRDQGVEVDDLSLTMELKGNPEEGLSLSGDVRLVSGRYLQDFNVRNLVISRRINESDSRPAWKDQPLLDNLVLGLRVRTEGDGFVVQNNLAPEIHIIIDLGINGTLSSPTISGEIRPTDGRFHIIGLRGDFELSPNVNHVTFVPTKSLAMGDTPELNLEAQNLVLDASGVEHTALMKIRGPINQATIDLSTTDGMDRNQTLMLLLSGRTTDDLSGNSGQVFGMNRQSGLDMLGQVSRDAVSNLVEPYIGQTLQMLTGRKLNLRPTVGADGFELKIQARATRAFDLEMLYRRGFQSQELYRAQGLAWIHDYLTGRLIGERLTYSQQQGLPAQTNKLSLELTLEYPIRFPIP